MNRAIFWIVCGLGFPCLLAGFGALVLSSGGSVEPLIPPPPGSPATAARTTPVQATPVQVTDELQTTPKSAEN